MNVTDTASAAASRLMTLQVGGAERFSIRKDGQAYFAGIVGIGTTSPGYQLDIASSETSLGYAMRLRSNPTATAAILQFTNAGVTQQNGVFGVTDAGLVTIQADGVSSAIALRTSGGERMRITAAGDVGIGTSSPANRLDVVAPACGAFINSTGQGTASLFMAGNSGSASLTQFGGELRFNTGGTANTSASGAAERMRIDSSGNLLVGTTTTAYSTAGRGLVEINGSSSSLIALKVGDAARGYFAASSTAAEIMVPAANPLIFGTNNTERARIDGSGNIGVGTSTIAGGRMQINGQVSDTDGTGLDQGQLLITDSDNNTSSGLMLGYRWNAGVAEYARIQARNAAGATNLIIQAGGGNVGIGTSSPTSVGGFTTCTVNGANGSWSEYRQNEGFAFRVGTDSSIGGFLYHQGEHPIRFLTNNSERMRLTSEGRLLVGTSSAFDNVSFLGTQLQGGVATRLPGTGATSQLSFFNDNGRVGFIFTDGTSTGYSTSSDARLKHGIVDAPEASDLIDAIKVRSFKWNADNSEQRYGFVAQELAEVAPEAVHQPDEDAMMGVDYSKLVPMLVKEIQCLRARMAQLEISASTITFEGN
jgi:hypothetical protein